ncbi:MAG: metal ABC transporter substrate-binding protein [Acidimicrobiia bacterium]
MKKIVVLLVLVLVSTPLITSCSQDKSSSKTIVTSIYPFQYLVKEVVGNKFEVINVISQGVEPHEAELNVKSTQQLLNSDLALLIGNGFQPSIEKAAKDRSKQTIYASKFSSSKNPHIWLDIGLVKKIINSFTKSVSEIDKTNRAFYKRNAKKLLNKIEQLDLDYKLTINKCSSRTLITSHNAFELLAKSYKLKYKSILGNNPESEPTSKELSSLKKYIQSQKVKTVFVEESTSKKLDNLFKNDFKVEVIELSPIEFLTETQADKNENYLTIMKDNLNVIQLGLDCY